MSTVYGTPVLTPAQSVAGRIAHLFEKHADLQRIVVWRGGRDRIFVQPFREQRLGAHLIGVYTREVRIVDLIEDLAK
jgi:hypothetical protein